MFWDVDSLGQAFSLDLFSRKIRCIMTSKSVGIMQGV